MEVVEQHLFPSFGKNFRVGLGISLKNGSSVKQLRILQGAFAAAVSGLDAALGGVAAVAEEVNLPFHYRQGFPAGFHGVEILVEGGEGEFGVNGPAVHLNKAVQIPAGGAAAVVAYAVNL